MFLVGALRAIAEMLGLALLGQGVLYFLVGRGRDGNFVYRLLELITRPPRRLVARGLPGGTSAALVGLTTFLLIFCLWIGLAMLRKFL